MKLKISPLRSLPRRIANRYQENGLKFIIRVFITKTPLYFISGSIMRLLILIRNKIKPIPDPPTNRNAIAVLGRGPSLTRARELDFLEEFIITNNFNKESNNKDIDWILKNKRIIHLLNKGEPVLTPLKVLKYNIMRCQLTRLRPTNATDWWREERTRRGPEAVGLEAWYLPEEMEPLLREDFPDNVGLNAIIYAAHILGCDYVYAAGIDFYEQAEYMRDSQQLDWTKEKTRQKTLLLYNQMEEIASEFPDTQFHFVTHASFDPDAQNIHVYNTNGCVKKPFDFE